MQDLGHLRSAMDERVSSRKVPELSVGRKSTRVFMVVDSAAFMLTVAQMIVLMR